MVGRATLCTRKENEMIDFNKLVKGVCLVLALVIMLVAVSMGLVEFAGMMVGLVVTMITKL